MRWLSSPLRDCASPREATVPPRSRVFIYLGLVVTLLLLSYQLILDRAPSIGTSWTTIQGIIVADDDRFVPDVVPAEKELVLAAMQASNMSWVEEHLPEWRVNIYRADAKHGDGGLTVPVNKGNEAMVYLTYVFDISTLQSSIPSSKVVIMLMAFFTSYIIDRYWSLPEVSIFLHGGRYQWHVDNPLYDSVISISHLNLAFVKEAGYVNLRCAWSVGCPAELEPARYLRERPEDKAHPTAVEYPDRFMELFPHAELPEAVGTPCCSQFALSKTKIHEQSLEDYVRLQRWLMDTDLDAGISGRILEYSWHMIFGKPAQYCIDQRECYCQTYGYCNMTDSDIQKQWVWRGLQLPEGWPEESETAE
ncbi:uncharacterized protein N7479_005184 [Penicillium vulpinum]|uniref:uncharacterized protein n=1 Tax=Penicillium vulpinum TaxID=29845 RepID=UPI002549455E|nr:uncharacterized protein N7479_005184 [Penicillium vulpinum]KAJ5958034.1 hypothetical protein N7479_005184 [Penicillium vulpinum]